MALLFVEPIGRGVGRGELLRWLHKIGGLDRARVGKIQIHGSRATIEVPDGWQARLSRQLDGQQVGGRAVRVWAAAESRAGDPASEHFRRLARLLELESEAEARQIAERRRRLAGDEAERSGLTLLDLEILDEDAGLGGRRLLQLARRTRTPLPWSRFEVGTPVILSPNEARPGVAGYRAVVFERQETNLSIALAGDAADFSVAATWRLDLADDEVAMQRQRAALERASLASGDRLAELRDCLLGEREPQFDPLAPEEPLDNSLNPVQREAVEFALSARDVALIHGPPGTGKTTTVVELIRRAVRRGEKVLACAPSNLAVDNIFERLLAAGENAVRLGHPARVLPALRDHTLDLLVQQHPDVRLARKYIKEALGLFRRAERYTRAKPEPGARSAARQEARALMADARRMQAQAVEQILSEADILCATTTGIDSEVIGTRRFQLAVVDEACQSVEPGCWIPLLRSDRLVLAGDHCQLPPTIISREADEGGLGISLFERLVGMYGNKITRRLTVQYRMHEAIMEFPSREFYDGQLIADPSVATHRLADLPHVADVEATRKVIEFIDTAGAGYDEQLEPDGESRRNPEEAELVVKRVHQLLDAGVAPAEIAIIAPYAAQVRLLRERIARPGIEIDSVDGFQGREKEAVLISLVRSNPQGEIGFLAELRRVNVALTRARRRLIVVGDSATLSANPFYVRMLEYFESLGAYRTAWEEQNGE